MAVLPLHAIRFGRAAPTVRVRDIAIARRFYEDILGFRAVFENGDPVGFIVLAKDAAEIHLSRAPDHRASTTNVLHLMVNDASALHAALAAAGVRIVKRLADKDYGQRAFVFADPDGNRIDVGERINRRESASPAPSHSPA